MFFLINLPQIYTISIVVAYFFYVFFRLKKNGFKGNRVNFRVVTIDTFLCLTLLLASVAIYSGYKEKAVSDSLIQTNTAQFIGTVLAIFFSLAIVPVSNIVTNTSSAFVGQIFRNEVFVKSIFLYVLIFLAVSLQSLFGLNKIVSLIHFGYLFMSLVTFIFLIYETLRLMDVKNIISDFEKDVIYNLDQRWRNVTSKANDLDKQLQIMAVIKNNLIFETKTKIEPIFVTTKRYITLDHYDVVAKGLESIVNIATKYIDLFNFSIQDNDKLLNYLIERFKDLKNAITNTSHYSILPSLVWATKQLAIKALEIQTPMSKYHQSYLPLGLISFLKEFVVSKDIFNETSSASFDAVIGLEEIAIAAIQKENFNMARSALDKLTEVSVDCTKLNFFYSNQLSKECNAAIMNIHENMLVKFGNKYHLIPFLTDSVDKPIKAFIEVGDDDPSKNNLSPFIGTGVDILGITDPYSMRLFKHLPYIVFSLIAENAVGDKIILGYLEEIFSDLNRRLMEADDKKMFFLTKEIVDTAYAVSFTLMQFVEMKKIADIEGVKKILNSRLLYIFLNSFYGEFLLDGRWFDEKLDKWFAVVGLYLATFGTWEGFPTETIDRVLQKVVPAIPKVTEQFEGRRIVNYQVANDLGAVFEYLNLLLYWELNTLHNDSLKEKLVKFIISNQEQLHKDFEDSRLPRPVDALGNYWILDQPYVTYFQPFYWVSGTLLDVNNTDLYKYDQFMRKNELIWELTQLINFRLGKIKSYEIYGSRRSSIIF